MKPTLGAVYRHYKGGLYTVEDFAVHHDSEAELVLYRSHKTGLLRARPLVGTEADPDGWEVTVDGKERFERVPW